MKGKDLLQKKNLNLNQKFKKLENTNEIKISSISNNSSSYLSDKEIKGIKI